MRTQAQYTVVEIKDAQGLYLRLEVQASGKPVVCFHWIGCAKDNASEYVAQLNWSGKPFDVAEFCAWLKWSLDCVWLPNATPGPVALALNEASDEAEMIRDYRAADSEYWREREANAIESYLTLFIREDE